MEATVADFNSSYGLLKFHLLGIFEATILAEDRKCILSFHETLYSASN